MFLVTYQPYQFIIKILDFCLDNWATIDITYEELTQEETFPLFQSFLSIVGHYLWGIDTAIRSISFENFPFLVGHYLWGIDTSQKENKTQNQQNKNRRTLPMRNWHLNAWFNSSSSLLHSCWSDITYEELTQKVKSYSTFSTSSDITYEELTLAYPKLLDCPIKVVQVRRTLPMRNWHIVHKSVIEAIWCRTLPMRNWHQFLLWALWRHHRLVGHYLWGIDTFPDHIFFSS